MKDKQKSKNYKPHLKLATISFISWLFIGYIIIGEYRNLDGVSGLINEIKNANYSIMILLALSILLLSHFIRCIFLYLSEKDKP